MRKTIVVAVREYQEAVRSKAFVISIVSMPILMGGGILAQVFLKDTVDTTDRKIAVLDYSGVLYDAIATEARKRNRSAIFDEEDGERRKVRPQFLPERVELTDSDLDQMRLNLSGRVRNDELFAFVIIPPNILESQGDDVNREAVEIDYHSNNPTYRDLQRWVGKVMNGRIQRLRFHEAGLDPEVVAKATQNVPVTSLGLVSLDESGRITKAKASNRAANLIAPAAMMMLMFMVVMVAASPLLQSVLEEKMQRIAEVLLGSIPPFQLMMGKLLGTVGVSLTISTVYLVGAYLAVVQAGFAEFFPTHLILWFMLYQALAVLMFGSLFIAVGAAVSDLKESQSLITPVMIVIVAPLFLWGNVLQAPTATFSVVASLFPPATPMLMLLRQAIPPGVPFWQPLAGVAGVLLTTTLFVFAAGRIFRIGILMQGKGAKLGEMIRWAVRG